MLSSAYSAGRTTNEWASAHRLYGTEPHMTRDERWRMSYRRDGVVVAGLSRSASHTPPCWSASVTILEQKVCPAIRELGSQHPQP
jgi:hypothetical protein